MEIEEFLSSPSSLVFYDKDGVRITEEDMKKIFAEYFRKTNLEDVSYQWGEILNPEYLGDILEIFKMIKQGGGEPNGVIQLMTDLATKLDKSNESIQTTKKKKLNRAKKENEIRVWILSVGVNKL